MFICNIFLINKKCYRIFHQITIYFYLYDVSSFGREKYFITFIDNFSCYKYVYLLHEKSQSKKVEIVRSDRGSEYYEKYDESGQHKSSFAKFLESCGLCAQYTMLSTLEQKGVIGH